MEALIIEDEGHTARRLEQMLKEIEPDVRIVGRLDSISSSIEWFRTCLRPPDLVFMDIRLADGLSFEIFSAIDIKQPVIFTTAYDEYMLNAFKVNSIDYLLKPIELDSLRSSLRKFRELREAPKDISRIIQQVLQQRNYRSRFLVTYRDGYISIFADDIAYFFSAQRITHLITKDNKLFTIDETLEELEAQLDPNVFFRANRQFILRHTSIVSIKNYFNGKLKVVTTPPAKEDIVISRDKASAFKSWMDN